MREARELLAPVYGWFTEGFDTRDLKEAKGRCWKNWRHKLMQTTAPVRALSALFDRGKIEWLCDGKS